MKERNFKEESRISSLIIDSYYKKLKDVLTCDVAIVGLGRQGWSLATF